MPLNPLSLGLYLPLSWWHKLLKAIAIAAIGLTAGCDPAKEFQTGFLPVSATTATVQPEVDPFREAINYAQEAADLTQRAISLDEWHEVASLWRSAIAELKMVPETHPRSALAREKIAEYQHNLRYASQQVARLDRFERAIAKAQTATNLAQTASSKAEWEQVELHWEIAIANLTQLPASHPNRALATAKLAEYGQKLADVKERLAEFGAIQQALAKGKLAGNLTQSAASIAEWQRVGILWKEAIAKLQTVPPNHAKRTFAEAKIREYNYNLRYVRQQLSRLDPYNQAIATVERATASSQSANTMAEWEAAAKHWEEAIARLERVPKTHLNRALAEQHIRDARENLAFARQQVTHTDPFNQAMKKARDAAKKTQSAFSHYDWNVVASEWQSAILLLESLPKNHAKQAIASKKIAAYQKQLAYAIKQGDRRFQSLTTPSKKSDASDSNQKNKKPETGKEKQQ